MQIGLNLTSITPFAREWIFADPRRQAKVIPPVAPATATGYLTRDLAWTEPHKFEPAARNGQWARNFTNRVTQFPVLRFMDWQRTNGSPLVAWAVRRTTANSFTQADWGGSPQKGVAFELIADLCKLVTANPWLCVPHLADDDFVARMARFFASNLTSAHTVYLEFSNELWNAGPGFGQGDWVNLNTFAATPKVTYTKFVGDHLRRVFGIWSAEFALASAPPRLVRVVAGQAANPAVATGLCTHLGTGGFDAVSCAAYFDPRNAANKWPLYDATTTPATILSDCVAHLRTRTLPNITKHKALADTHGVPLLLYEAGQQLTASGKTVSYQRAMEAAQDDAGMGALYRELLDGAKAAGVDLLCHYASTDGRDSGGMWGIWETQDQKRSTKGDAVLDWIKLNP